MDTNEKGKTAVLIGSSGLIGSYLLNYLLEDPCYAKVRILVRRELEMDHPRLEVIKLDFNDHESFRKAMEKGEVVFCSVGTTTKNVKGDKELYRRVDVDIPVNAAKFAEISGCRHFLLVSAIGANSKSRVFYSRLKGEVEDRMKEIQIPAISIFRPSLLLGKRKEFRFGELLGQYIFPAIDSVFPSKIRSIKASDVARAMVNASHRSVDGIKIYHYRDMKSLA